MVTAFTNLDHYVLARWKAYCFLIRLQIVKISLQTIYCLNIHCGHLLAFVGALIEMRVMTTA